MVRSAVKRVRLVNTHAPQAALDVVLALRADQLLRRRRAPVWFGIESYWGRTSPPSTRKGHVAPLSHRAPERAIAAHLVDGIMPRNGR